MSNVELFEKKILVNKIHCKKCKDIIELSVFEKKREVINESR